MSDEVPYGTFSSITQDPRLKADRLSLRSADFDSGSSGASAQDDNEDQILKPHHSAQDDSYVRPFAYLKIADGCDRHCSYCTIPSIRGPYRSTPLDELLAQAREHIAAGTRELILIAQDTGRYGLDLEEPSSLIVLLDALTRLPGLKRLRLMYLQPEGLTDELLAFMAAHEVIVPYLEVPLQHASLEILRSMGRRPSDAQLFEKQIAQARALMPDIALRTTLIAAYPGETQEQFDELCAFVKRVGFDYVGVFAYSPEEGTAAAHLPAQHTPETRRQRAQILRDLADEIGWQKAANRVGKHCEVLIEGHDEEEEECYYGRAPFQTPDIDGIVYVAGLDALPLNSYQAVELKASMLYDLEGEIID